MVRWLALGDAPGAPVLRRLGLVELGLVKILLRVKLVLQELLAQLGTVFNFDLQHQQQRERKLISGAGSEAGPIGGGRSLNIYIPSCRW